MNQALKRFLAGQCTSEEAREIIKWIRSEEGETELAQAVEELWREYEDQRNENARENFDKQEIYRRILARIQEEPAPNLSFKAEKPLRRRIYIPIAATVLPILAATAIFVATWNRKEANPPPAADELVVKSASLGQKSTIFLPDGTKVRLNSGSEITFLSQFTGKERLVELNGEAFFEVASDPSRPFIVASKEIETIAIGTSFNVKAYPEDKEVMVSLASGKVKIKQKHNFEDQSFELVLDPGHQAIYNTAKNTIRKTEFNAKRTLSWKDNILYFEDAEWEEIVNQLERWYGVKIAVENEIYEDKLYSGEFNDASLKNVLESLSFTKNFSYRIHGNEVIIKDKGGDKIDKREWQSDNRRYQRHQIAVRSFLAFLIRWPYCKKIGCSHIFL